MFGVFLDHPQWLLFGLVSRDSVSLGSSGYPETHSMDQAGFELSLLTDPGAYWSGWAGWSVNPWNLPVSILDPNAGVMSNAASFYVGTGALNLAPYTSMAVNLFIELSSRPQTGQPLSVGEGEDVLGWEAAGTCRACLASAAWHSVAGVFCSRQGLSETFLWGAGSHWWFLCKKETWLCFCFCHPNHQSWQQLLWSIESTILVWGIS